MRGYNPRETEAIKETANGFEDFADENVNLTTEVITWDSVFQEWEAGIQGRAAPNETETAGEFALGFAQRGAMDPLTEAFEEYDDWFDLMGAWGLWEDEVWAVPWFIETRITTHNMELLNEAGHDQPPETWEELIKVAQDVKSNTDAAGGFGTPGAQDYTTGQNLYSIVCQSGGQYYGIEDGQWTVGADSNIALFGNLWYASLGREWDASPGGVGGMASQNVSELYRSGQLGIMQNPMNAHRSMVADDSDLVEKTAVTKMPAGPMGTRLAYWGGSTLASFKDETSKHEAGGLSDDFVSYMSRVETKGGFFPEAAPVMLPVREAETEAQPYSDNPTDVPDEWLATAVDQASDEGVRQALYGAGENGPFTGGIEGATVGYSQAISGILGNDQDPKQSLLSLGNTLREQINSVGDNDIALKEEPPSLEDLPSELEPWVTGDNGTPKIWNPYE
jgi:multiple sugar transport system substrate-binding protein